MKRLCLVLLFASASALALTFTDDEARKIQSHGPWPRAVDGRSEQPRLGQRERNRPGRTPVLSSDGSP